MKGKLEEWHDIKEMEAEGLEEDSRAVPTPAVKEDSGKVELDEKEHGRAPKRRSDAELPRRGQD